MSTLAALWTAPPLSLFFAAFFFLMFPGGMLDMLRGSMKMGVPNEVNPEPNCGRVFVAFHALGYLLVFV